MEVLLRTVLTMVLDRVISFILQWIYLLYTSYSRLGKNWSWSECSEDSNLCP